MRSIYMPENIHTFIKKLLENDIVQQEGRKMESPSGEEITITYELFHRKSNQKKVPE